MPDGTVIYGCTGTINENAVRLITSKKSMDEKINIRSPCLRHYKPFSIKFS
jgi:hypothetical protein